MKIKAYSLLEISISLIIIGITLTSFTSLFFYMNKFYEKKLDFQKKEYIKNAMQNYLSQNGYLPFASKDNGISENDLLEGEIPYKTLNIPKNYTLNHKKQNFKYYVNKKFTKDNTIILPIQFPIQHKYKNNTTTFARKYKIINNILHYDNNENDSLIIEDDNKKNILELDYFFAWPPIKEIKLWHEMVDYIDKIEEKEELKIFNNIAWIITTEKCNKINDSYIFILSDNLYYQTRFEMLAQSGFYCTKEPVNI